jgi:hypothetical protein
MTKLNNIPRQICGCEIHGPRPNGVDASDAVCASCLADEDDCFHCPRCGGTSAEATYSSDVGPVCAACELECREGDAENARKFEEEQIEDGFICPDCRQDWGSASECLNLEHVARMVMES